jgi:hypothetical protein
MEIFQFDGANGLPAIFLDKRNKTFEIIGTSFPEDSIGFYEPVFKWLKHFEANPEPTLTVTFKLEYFNTSSSKIIQNFIDIFDRLHKAGTKVSVKWFYSDDDEEIYEAGVGYSEKIKFSMELIPIKE